MAGPLGLGERWGAGWRWGAGGLLGCTVLGVGALAGPAAPPVAEGTVAPRTSLAGVPLDGRDAEAVRETARELAARLRAHPLTIRFGDRQERTTVAKLGGEVDLDAAVAAVLDPSRGPDSLLDRIREKLGGPEQKDVPLPVRFTEPDVRSGLARFAVRIGAEPRNARLTKLNGRFKRFPPAPGKELDTSALIGAMLAALDAPALRQEIAGSLGERRPDWIRSRRPLALEATLREARPHVTLKHLEPITSLLATYRTSLGGSSRNRRHNVMLACRAVDGQVLLPGDLFSYNEVVGPRVPSAGYREAPVIIRGKLQPGTGGGICQVSSTLYNAALLADLEIVRRRHHAFPVPYVPPGRDATVVDGLIDFRFKNRLAHPIAIDAKVVGRRMVVSIYGHPEDRREVTITSSRVSRIPAGMKTVLDSRMTRGRRVVVESARAGRRVTISRTVRRDGTVLRREVVSRDYYRPFAGVVRLGTRAVPRRAPARDPQPETPTAAPAELPAEPVGG